MPSVVRMSKVSTVRGNPGDGLPGNASRRGPAVLVHPRNGRGGRKTSPSSLEDPVADQYVLDHRDHFRDKVWLATDPVAHMIEWHVAVEQFLLP